MPGYSATALVANARNANTVAVLIGDQVVAFAQTASHHYSLGAEQLYGVGSALPQEIQQMKISPAISLSMFALTETGTQLLAGNSNIGYSLGNTAYDLHLVDGATQDVIFTYVGCVADSFSESIQANSPVSQDIPFLAMDVWDSNGNSVLNTGNAVSISTIAASAGAAAGGLGIL